MSKEIKLANGIPTIIEFMEEAFIEEDGINKMTMLKTVAAYYENVVANEVLRNTVVKVLGNIK